MALWQFLAILALALGAWYLHWRWTASLNTHALWFAVPMALAETLGWLGLTLFVYNLWDTKDYPKHPPPASIGECDPASPEPARPVRVDVFICTYDEDEALVRLSIRDALAIRRPHGLQLNVHVLDDGQRQSMRRLTEAEGANYITRTSNAGFKAGNLSNAMEQTDGDFILICDADTRAFPSILENTLGYFRDPDVAFVQTPQWFFDLPEGEPLHQNWQRRFGAPAATLARGLQRIFGPLKVGEDPFVNDALIFYDIIQRRRNRVNAAFCCGAGSLHRREAVMFVALRAWSDAIARAAKDRQSLIRKLARKSRTTEAQAQTLWKAAQAQQLTPYKFHVSEDLYTTIALQQDRQRRWKSVLHPPVESKMLSPQDMLTWSVQRFKYAGGSLDILFNDNPLLRPGLSLGQRLMYLSTFWSYLAALWNLVFLLAPIIYLWTGIAPIHAYSTDFFLRLIPFLVTLEIAMLLGHWGRSGYTAKVTFLAGFPLSLQALWAVLRGQKISFPITPKSRQEGNFLKLVQPQIAIIVLGISGIAVAGLSMALGSNLYSPGGLIANSLWALFNAGAMAMMVRAALWRPPPPPQGAAA